MLKANTHHVSTTKSLSGSLAETSLPSIVQPKITTASRPAKLEFVDYIALDRFRKETTLKQEETNRQWKTKYDPWLIDEYRTMHENIRKIRGNPPEHRVIPLTRPEWQQPADALPPLQKRLPGQKRRRLLGAFPQTESDKIGWRLLPEHAIDKYGSKISNIPPLPKQYKFSSWPVESFH